MAKQRVKGIQFEGVVFKDGDVWVARCLTIDHATQADNPAAAIRECIDTLTMDVQHAIENDTLNRLKPAPIADRFEFWARKKKGGGAVPAAARLDPHALPATSGDFIRRNGAV